MALDERLNKFRKEVCSMPDIPPVDEARWRGFLDNCVVALPAGGQGQRLKEFTDSQNANKTAFCLSNGQTMIERTIAMYRDAGFREFVALVFHRADSVKAALGDGERLAVNIRYSHDPKWPIGRGGAIRNAYNNGSIGRNKYLIVHNPDDQIVNSQRSFPRHIVEGHLAGEARGALGSAVVVEVTPYAFTGMEIDDGWVKDMGTYPPVPIPAHIGVTVFSPKARAYFEELFDLKKKMDFEGVLFPQLIEEGLLFSVGIPSECWLAVNDFKGLSKLEKYIQAEPECRRASSDED